MFGDLAFCLRLASSSIELYSHSCPPSFSVQLQLISPHCPKTTFVEDVWSSILMASCMSTNTKPNTQKCVCRFFLLEGVCLSRLGGRREEQFSTAYFVGMSVWTLGLALHSYWPNKQFSSAPIFLQLVTSITGDCRLHGRGCQLHTTMAGCLHEEHHSLRL